MICPQCQAEYREGFSRCVDCDVPLIHKAVVSAVGDPEEDPFCAFWRGEDPRLHTELCSILDEAAIPHKTVQRRDHLFNLANYPSFELGVPFSLFEKAEAAIGDAFELDPADREALLALSMPPLLPETTASTRKVLPMFSPSKTGAVSGPPRTSDSGQTQPESVTAELWSGNDFPLEEMLLAALNENAIKSRTDNTDGHATLFVEPQHLGRAREILREIIESAATN
jgi:hypothetical protein